jgi:tRNA threonylcarbamoyladenosine biosynthesis protein TsaB
MLIAALDASTDCASAALLEIKDRSRRVVVQREQRWGTSSEVRPLHLLTEVVTKGGFILEQIDGFAVGVGPGPGVGLAESVTALKAIAATHQRPLTEVSSLEALARAGGDLAPLGAILIPMVGDGRGCHLGFFRVDRSGELEPLRPEAQAAPSQLQRVLESVSRPVGVGEAWRRLGVAPSLLLDWESASCATPRATQVGLLASRSLIHPRLQAPTAAVQRALSDATG